MGGSVVGVAGIEAGPVCRVRGGIGFGPGGPVGARARCGRSRRGEVEGRDARCGDRGARGRAAASRRGGPAPAGGRRTARSGTAPCRGEAGRGEESPPNGSRPRARGHGAAARKPSRPRSDVERGRHQRDDGRQHRRGPRRGRVGRGASRPASRRAVGRGGRRPVPSGTRQARGGGSGRRISTTPSRRPKRCGSGSPACGSCSRRRAATRRCSRPSITGIRSGRARERRPTSSGRSMSPSRVRTVGGQLAGSTGWSSKRNSSSRMPRARRGGERVSASTSSPIPAVRAGASLRRSRTAPARLPSRPSGPSRRRHPAW